MGKYLEKFKHGMKKVDQKVQKWSQEKPKKTENSVGDFGGEELNDYDDLADLENENFDRYDDMAIQQAQRPESFHHFILENQYKDLERSIRGFKDVFDKEKQQWVTIRKREHCFTDEEAEEILRTAQSHLATDIKLGNIGKDQFPVLMDTIYQEIAFIFESIAEYRYGRYNKFDKNGKLISVNYDKQYEMKLQNHKIFLELFTRIQANYSRAIAGQENKFTHDSVKGQESLQQGDRDLDFKRRYS